MFKIDRHNVRYMSVGLNIAVGMFVFFYLGYWLDKRWGGQLWTLVGIFLGLFYCAYEIWKLIRDLNRQNKL